MKPRVLLDVDGVLADFVGAFLAVVEQQLGRSHTAEDVHSFGIANSLNLSKDEFDRCAEIVGKPGFCRSLAVCPGAIEGVAQLRELAEVYIVTSPWNTNPTWTHDREQWLAEHFGIPSARVVHTSAKHLVRGDVLVDDKTETLRDWLRERDHGGIAVQWQTPHNRLDGWRGRATNDWALLATFVQQHAEAVRS